MSRRSVNLMSVALLVAIAAAVSAFVTMRWLGGPLSGDRRHDFGIVWIDGESASVTHTFRLVNDASVPLAILAARPSCGCTTVKASEGVLAPGAVLELPATLKLTATGPKKAHIDIAFDQDGRPRTKVLWVEAIGRRKQTLFSQETQVHVAPGVKGSVRIYFEELDNDDRPSDPAITVPPACRASFTGWELKQARHEGDVKPAVWSGRVVMDLEGEAVLPAGAVLLLELPPDQKLTFELVDHPVYMPVQGPAAGRRGGQQLDLPGER